MVLQECKPLARKQYSSGKALSRKAMGPGAEEVAAPEKEVTPRRIVIRRTGGVDEFAVGIGGLHFSNGLGQIDEIDSASGMNCANPKRPPIPSSAKGCSILITPVHFSETWRVLHGSIMAFSLETKDLARSILAYEAAAGRSSEPAEPVAVRVCKQLREPFGVLAGVAGYRALLARALTLARADAPSLGALQVTSDGYLQGFVEPASHSDGDHASESEVLLTAQLLGLFLSLLGEALTFQMVQDIFPNLTVTTETGTRTPFEDILQEVGHLMNVSDRLELLADQHPAVEDALMSVSGNVRNTATALEVFALISNKPGEAEKKTPKQPRDHYLM
jgi:hypothetical protein